MMRKKVIVSVFIIAILIIFKYYIVNADNENSTLNLISDIDSNGNITLNLQSTNIRAIDGTVDYDSEELEYIGIEKQNNWEVDFDSNTLQISAVSQNASNIENKDIAILKFKIKNIEEIIKTTISITDIKILKDDDTVGQLNDLNSDISINEDNTVTENENIDNDNDETVQNDLFDGENENDKDINYGSDLEGEEEYRYSEEEAEYAEDDEIDLDEDIDVINEEEENELFGDEVVKQTDNMTFDNNTIKQEEKSPQTGDSNWLLEIIIILFSSIVVIYTQKKGKNKQNNLEK